LKSSSSHGTDFVPTMCATSHGNADYCIDSPPWTVCHTDLTWLHPTWSLSETEATFTSCQAVKSRPVKMWLHQPDTVLFSQTCKITWMLVEHYQLQMSFILRSNCMKLQKEVQEKYPLLFQWNIFSHDGKKIRRLGNITLQHAIVHAHLYACMYCLQLYGVSQVLKVPKSVALGHCPLFRVYWHAEVEQKFHLEFWRKNIWKVAT
jgi:hypothetical protein